MRIFALIALVIISIGSVVPVYGEYSSTAYGGTQGDTIISKISDWFATAGKPEEEKYRIKAQRRGERKIKKAKKDIVRKKKEIAKKKKAFAE